MRRSVVVLGSHRAGASSASRPVRILGARRRLQEEEVLPVQRAACSLTSRSLWLGLMMMMTMTCLLSITSFHHFNNFHNEASSVRGVSAAEQQRWLALAPTYTSRSAADQQQDRPIRHWAQPSAGYVIDPSDLWESNDQEQPELPDWMIQYFRFHKEQRHQQQQQSQLQTQRYLYVTCLAEYRKCGGTADRLLPLPFLVMVAASSRRILLIQWTQPAALEEFLMPPEGGLDWRVKDAASWLQTHSEKAGDEASIVELAHRTTLAVVQVKFQSHHHGAGYYNRHRLVRRLSAVKDDAKDDDAGMLEPDFDTVFAGLWRIVFTPSPALARHIQEQIVSTQPLLLAPGQYVAVHVRALYGVPSRPEAVIALMTKNAMQCTVQFFNDGIDDNGNNHKPVVYVASDSLLAVQNAMDYGTAHGLTVVSATTTNSNKSNYYLSQPIQPPLHLDKTLDWKKRPASDFMNVFVDLYLLGSSRCVTYGMGGFGPLAALISRTGAATCHAVHMNATVLADCPALPSSLSLRKQPPQSTGEVDPATRHAQLWSSLFLPPMNFPNES